MISAKIILDEAEIIYKEKLEEVKKELANAKVGSKKFDSLLATYSNLISLMLQKAEFDRRLVLTDEEEKQLKKLTKKVKENK